MGLAGCFSKLLIEIRSCGPYLADRSESVSIHRSLTFYTSTAALPINTLTFTVIDLPQMTRYCIHADTRFHVHINKTYYFWKPNLCRTNQSISSLDHVTI